MVAFSTALFIIVILNSEKLLLGFIVLAGFLWFGRILVDF